MSRTYDVIDADGHVLEPPTGSELAERGIPRAAIQHFQMATQLLGRTREFPAYLATLDADAALAGCNARERKWPSISAMTASGGMVSSGAPRTALRALGLSLS